ncbi:hemolysin III family protein [Oxalobacteraceae bacterium OM1]|nr:hemolysin III family protein [Oxalobacteraceae bacterium OM1]
MQSARAQTLYEEVANAASHGIGFVLAVAAFPALAAAYPPAHDPVHALATGVFAATMILLYLVSCVYHALPAGRAKQWLNRVDHAAIYLFIAGTHTPFMAGVLRGHRGAELLVVIWIAALCGAWAKLSDRLQHPLWSTALYIALGGMGIVVAGPMAALIPVPGLAWLAAGGAFYIAGAVLFHFDGRIRFAHFVWHLFVLAGSLCHFVAVLRYSR